MLGMNRLRNAYVALDPGIEPYIVTSRYDDMAGLMASYLMGARRSMASHVLGSTAMFINVVNAMVAGSLGALLAHAADSPTWLIWIIGVLSGFGYLGGTITVARRKIHAELPQPISVPLDAVRWSEQRRLIVDGNRIGAGRAGDARPVPGKAVQPMSAQKHRRPASEI